MNLSDFIRSIGVGEFARRFGVSERAATSWLYGQRLPRAAVAKRIVADSPVTWDGIYAPTRADDQSTSQSASHAAEATAAGTTTA